MTDDRPEHDDPSEEPGPDERADDEHLDSEPTARPPETVWENCLLWAEWLVRLRGRGGQDLMEEEAVTLDGERHLVTVLIAAALHERIGALRLDMDAAAQVPLSAPDGEGANRVMVANHARKNAARVAKGPGQSHRQAVDAMCRGVSAEGQLLVAPGDRLSRGYGSPYNCPIELGDVLRVSCPAGEARVVEVRGDATAVIAWPWPEPEVTGPSTFPVRLPEAGAAHIEPPFRSTPPLTRGVREGAVITVDMPPTILHVCHVSMFVSSNGDMPIGVLPRGVSETREMRDDVDDPHLILRPWSGAPMTVELLYRPYPMLWEHDLVRDATGATWKYTGALDFDRVGWRSARAEGPVWPLTLTERLTLEARPHHAEEVAAAAATGSHQEELDRWRRASGADLAEV